MSNSTSTETSKLLSEDPVALNENFDRLTIYKTLSERINIFVKDLGILQNTIYPLSGMNANTMSIESENVFYSSPLENLPCELLFLIFDYVSESVCELRSCSKVLQARVDKYALHPGISLVQQLSLHCRFPNLSSSIIMSVPMSKKNLFELHLKFMQSKPDDLKIEVSKVGIMRLMYKIPWTNEMENESIMQWLQDCIGNTVGSVELFVSGERTSWNFFYQQLLERIRFKSLRFHTDTITNDSALNVLKLLNVHNIDHLYVYYAKETLSDPLTFLMDISNAVRSLLIYFQNTKNEQSNMFGIHNPGGSSIIVDMFSRKLDKLAVCNYSRRRESLPECWADILCERLPYLGKKVWFKSAHNVNNNSRRGRINGHIVHRDTSELNIRHISRKREEN